MPNRLVKQGGALRHMSSYSSIVVLSGAGLSAESGVATFRDRGGIWSEYDWQDVATPEGFSANPERVHEFYNLRRRLHATVKPNAAHQALADLEKRHPNTAIVTQNVDGLLEIAGVCNVIHMHGEILKALCAHCGYSQAWHDDLAVETACSHCGQTGGMRPDVVWFGEMPYHLEEILERLQSCDLFASIGTSGNVYPAAGFVAEAKRHGARTVELNLEPSQGASFFDEAIYGPASTVVPSFFERILAGTA